jgi:hypothetical protein
MVPTTEVSMLSRVLFLVFVASLAGCNRLDPQECTKLRDKSFELINQASQCTQDSDCKPSEWPGCAKPVNNDSFGKIHAMMDTFKKGKCEEKPAECPKTLPVYCQEGLCAFRYKPYEPPGGGMKIE